MEAPEKIYLLPRQGGDYAPYWKTDSQDDFGIEYTRTDAFIEKACEGIEHLLSGYIIRNFHFLFGDSYEMDTLIKDFKKYMEE